MSTAILERPQPFVQSSAMPFPSLNLQQDLAKRVQTYINSLYEQHFATLKQAYRIPDEQGLHRFLYAHRYLIPFLLEGRAIVKIFFGEETPVKLHVQHDHEADIDLLNAWIQTDLPADAAVERLLEFGDAWFCEQISFVGERLNFNLGVAG